MRRTDAEIFTALDELCGLNGKDLEMQEKALGFCCIEGAITLDPAVRHEMPPLLSCNEVLHDYFANGVASLELALLRQALSAEAGISLDEIQEQLVAERWHRCGEGRSFAVGTLRRLLHQKCWEEEKKRKNIKEMEMNATRSYTCTTTSSGNISLRAPMTSETASNC